MDTGTIRIQHLDPLGEIINQQDYTIAPKNYEGPCYFIRFEYLILKKNEELELKDCLMEGPITKNFYLIEEKS